MTVYPRVAESRIATSSRESFWFLSGATRVVEQSESRVRATFRRSVSFVGSPRRRRQRDVTLAQSAAHFPPVCFWKVKLVALLTFSHFFLNTCSFKWKNVTKFIKWKLCFSFPQTNRKEGNRIQAAQVAHAIPFQPGSGPCERNRQSPLPKWGPAQQKFGGKGIVIVLNREIRPKKSKSSIRF